MKNPVTRLHETQGRPNRPPNRGHFTLGSSGNYGPPSSTDISGFTPPFTAALH
jgi:hypothetical protein